MAAILKKGYHPFLSALGFVRSQDPNPHVPCGVTYEMNPELGSGRSWVYPVDDSCAIAIYHAVFKNDFVFSQSFPSFLYLGAFEANNASPPVQFRGAAQKAGLTGYVGDSGEYNMRIPKGLSLSSVGISMTRDYCESRLSAGPLEHALGRLDGSVRVPELACVFQQLKSFRPARSVAKIYYESKIMELLAYVMQWHILSESAPLDAIPDDDKARLLQVEDHLRNNYVRPVGLHGLAAMACMSQNKLTALFKRVHGRTITEYVQSLRLDRAKDLLLRSDLKIEAIANEIGYQHHGSFSELFKRSTGMTPLQFRSHSLCGPTRS